MCVDDGCDDILCCLCVPLAALCCCKCCKDMVGSRSDSNQVPTTVYYQQPGGQVPQPGMYGPQGYMPPPPQQAPYYPGGAQPYYPPPPQQPGYPVANQPGMYPPYNQGPYYPPQPGYGGNAPPPPYMNQPPNPYK